MNTPQHQAALARLQASREVLRRELVPAASDQQLDPTAGGHASLSHWWRKLRRMARRWPVTELASKVVQSWWRVQPWSGTGELLAGSLIQQGRPLVRSHPIAAMGIAAAAGGLLVAFRPWRWALAELKRLPLQTAWATLLVQTLMETRHSAAPEEKVAPDQQQDQAAA